VNQTQPKLTEKEPIARTEFGDDLS